MSLYLWRHPKPLDVEGVFLGHTDAKVDSRKIKRLANKIERYAKRHQLPKEVWVSHLQRSRLVGERLAARGWLYHVDPMLAELDFGAWDGKHWQDIGHSKFDLWCNDFANYNFSERGETGESLKHLFIRVRQWIDQHTDLSLDGTVANSCSKNDGYSPSLSSIVLNKNSIFTISNNTQLQKKSFLTKVTKKMNLDCSQTLVVGHAGWINAAKFVLSDKGAPYHAKDWPSAVPYMSLSVFK